MACCMQAVQEACKIPNDSEMPRCVSHCFFLRKGLREEEDNNRCFYRNQIEVTDNVFDEQCYLALIISAHRGRGGGGGLP